MSVHEIDPPVPTSIRLPRSVLKELDAVGKRMSAEAHGVRISRAQTIAIVIREGLRALKTKVHE